MLYNIATRRELLLNLEKEPSREAFMLISLIRRKHQKTKLGLGIVITAGFVLFFLVAIYC